MAGQVLPGHDEPPGPPQPPVVRRLDGRLDLDHLDLPTDLDLLDDGHDSPLLEERLRAALDDAGVTDWARRHRRTLAAGGVLVVAAVAVGGVWWAARPEPLPETPHVLVRSSGADPGAYVVLDPTTGIPTGVIQSLSITSAERPGVEVQVVGLSGPGLATGPVDGAGTAPDPTETEQHVSGAGRLDCSTRESTTAVVGASPSDYRVLVRRVAPEGEARVDQVRFVGAQSLRGLVLDSCVQLAADRDLQVASLAAAPVRGVVAADLDIVVRNDSPRIWVGLRVTTAATPVLATAGSAVDLQPGTSAHVHARLWPQDCARPAGALDAGLALQANLGPDGRPADGGAGITGFHLAVPPDGSDDVARAFATSCGGTAPVVTVRHAAVADQAGGSSAGVIGLTVAIAAPGSTEVSADPVGALSYGRLIAPTAPARTAHGTAQMELRWELPSCEQVVQDGPLRLALTLPGDPQRPYRPEIRGDELRAALATLCGGQVAAVAA